MHDDPQRRMHEVADLLSQGRGDEAAAACEALRAACPMDAGVQSWASNVAQRLGAFDRMVEAAAQASRLEPGNAQLRRRLVECWVYCGRIDQARECLAEDERRAGADAGAWLRIAELHFHCEGHADAFRCHERAAALAPRDPQALHGLASSAIALGRIDEAQALFERLLALSPLDGDALLGRAGLRTWTTQTHHLGEIEAALRMLPAGDPARVPLHYARGKELEDLGDATAAFAAYAQGAAQRRAQMGYRVEGDVRTMARIAETFDADLLARAAPVARDDPSIFVLGLPRSGTTLVDRILGSHSAVAGLGEVNALVFALLRLAAGGGDKKDLIERSARIDFAQLGSLYRDGAASYGLGSSRLVNKTPSNFLYLGLLHLALPGASIVHLRRHPLDSCLAMFKTLFRMGYPYSYSLEDLADYYIAYDRLMGHWREAMPGGFLDLDYEALVADQAGSTRRLLDHCGLPFEQACLAFHRNAAPTATASAAQVRRPLYASSVGRWQSCREQLEPLAERLRAHGIDCD